MKHSPRRPSGFTLVEMLIVLAIAALLSGILFSAFRSVSEGNRKSSCQNNLVQIYQAARLYAQDFNGEFPFLNHGAITDTSVPQNGLGLWALYAYPKSNSQDCDGLTSKLPDPNNSDDNAAPLASYLKSPRFLHCPFDSFGRAPVTSAAGCAAPAPAGAKLQSDVLQYTDSAGKSHLNPFYNSYQGIDTDTAIPAGPAQEAIERTTYSSFRNPDPGDARQLVRYTGTASSANINPTARSADTTIIAWCRFHRQLDSDGNTVANAGNFDNVLFLDGSVQYIPTTQSVGTATCEGWHRVPLEIADRLNTSPTPPTACP